VDDCAICAKHRAEGPLKGELVGRWGGFWVYHAPAGEDGTASLGYLFIETDRHAPHLEDLSDEEASALGILRSHLARALASALDAENVFSAVIGRGVPHFHEHLFARHRGTPADIAWDDSPDAAPRADDATVTTLALQLRANVDMDAA
jgi:ATP adenylyltransferase